MKGDMTAGSPMKILVLYAIPLILGNVCQQLYNTTDAIVVGQFVGKNALAAVGVANPIMSVALFFIIGLCIGISVLQAQVFGSGDYKALKREVSTGLIVGAVLTGVLSLLFMGISSWVLTAIGTPAEIISEADRFLKIIFAGLLCSFLYNYYSSALRAIGDSLTPLVFLILSCFANGALCILFVVVFKWGVAGSAIATVLAQAMAAAACMVYVYFKVPLLRLGLKDLIIDRSLVKKILQFGWVTALQQTCLFLGLLLIQGAVNPLGINSIAAYNAATRIDSFILAPGDSLSNSVATFAAQNKGKGQMLRIIEGYKKGNWIVTLYNVFITATVFLGAEEIMKLFVSSSETEVIQLGAGYLKVISVFYILSGFNNVFQGLFRGVGMLRITFVVTILQMFVRVTLSYLLASHLNITSISYATGAGWIVMFVYEGLACRKLFKGIKKSHSEYSEIVKSTVI